MLDTMTALSAAAALEKEVASLFFYSDWHSTNNANGSLWVWMTVLPIGFYSAISIYSSAVECYRFVAVWNRILQTHRMDSEIVNFHKNQLLKRKRLMDQVLESRKVKDSISSTSPYYYSWSFGVDPNQNKKLKTIDDTPCPICLADFVSSDIITFCKDKKNCQHVFHKECLRLWLQKHSSCPCCRHNILALDPAPTPHPLFTTSSMTSQGMQTG